MFLFPKAALAQHIAVLGKTGSGKSYAVRGIVEGLLDDSARVCIIDPTGAWNGLRSSATGKSRRRPDRIEYRNDAHLTGDRAVKRRLIAWLKRCYDRLFPVYTHCASCGEELPKGHRTAICWRCDAW
jgi:DNA helicase HerA-like ATPase